MRSVEDFALTNALLKQAYAGKVTLNGAGSEHLKDILAENPRLVVAMNHGPVAGPVAGAIGMLDQYLKNGGEHRKPVIIAWRGFYSIPVIKYGIQYLSQVRKPLNLNGYVAKLTEQGFTDVFVMPEGENCSFGNGLDIQPFLSPKFIELALKADAPILIAVHLGSEQWSSIYPLSKKLDPLFKRLPKKTFERIAETRQLNLFPLWLKKIPELKLSFKLYKPEITLEDLNAENRYELLQRESDKVRALMQGEIDELVAG